MSYLYTVWTIKSNSSLDRRLVIKAFKNFDTRGFRCDKLDGPDYIVFKFPFSGAIVRSSTL